MAINVTIDNTEYPGVNQINVGGKSLLLSADAISGGDVPSWLAACHVQEYIPAEDTNADVEFSHNLGTIPDIIMVISDMDNNAAVAAGLRTIVGMVARLIGPAAEGSTNAYDYAGAWKNTITAISSTTMYSNSSTETAINGPVAVTSEGFALRAPNIGGTRGFWKAGHTYQIISARL